MGLSKKDYKRAVEILGQEPTCLFVSVLTEVPNTDPLNEQESTPGMRYVHLHAEGYDGACLPATGHVPALREYDATHEANGTGG